MPPYPFALHVPTLPLLSASHSSLFTNSLLCHSPGLCSLAASLSLLPGFICARVDSLPHMFVSVHSVLGGLPSAPCLSVLVYCIIHARFPWWSTGLSLCPCSSMLMCAGLPLFMHGVSCLPLFMPMLICTYA